MPTIKDHAICLRQWDFSESSQTVSLLLREHGIVRGLAKGAKRERGRFSGGFDVLTAGEALAIVKPGRPLATLTDWMLRQVWSVVRRDLEANRIGFFAIDLIHHMLAEHDAHPRLYDATIALLDAVQAGDDRWRALLRFQCVLLNETGYAPELDRLADADESAIGARGTLGFSARAGGVVTDTGSPDRWRVRASTIDLIRAVTLEVAESPPPLEHAVHAVARDDMLRANRLLAAYLREVLGEEPATMHWLFPDLGSRIGEGARPRQRRSAR